MAYRSHGLCSYELTSSSWPTTSKQRNGHAMLTGSVNSVIFMGPKRVAKNPCNQRVLCSTIVSERFTMPQ